MVILEGSISHKVFNGQIGLSTRRKHHSILRGLSKICAGTLFAYFFLQLLVFVHGRNWSYLSTPMGWWYLTELIGFVFIPMVLFFVSYRKNSTMLIRIAAIFTILGIIINRLNVSVIGFRWDAASQYIPSWMEIVVTLAIILTEIWIFRWVINRMPVLREGKVVYDATA